MAIEVILKKDVPDLGEEGDIRRVAKGYARNYLLPFGFVVLKTQKTLAILEKEKEIIEAKKRQKLEKSKDIAQEMEQLQLQFWLRASKTGKLFGSITATDLFQELEEKGFSQIKKNQIQLSQPIKSLGNYSIPVKIYGNLMAQLKIQLLDQNERESLEKEESQASHKKELPEETKEELPIENSTETVTEIPKPEEEKEEEKEEKTFE